MAHRGVYLAPYSGVLTVGREFLLFWEFIDGLYLCQGVDLYEMFHQVNAYRMFNVIDSILVEEGIKAGKTENAYEKARTEILKVYNSNDTRSGYSDEEYESMYGTRSDYSQPVKPYIPTIEPTENGYPGLLPPVN